MLIVIGACAQRWLLNLRQRDVHRRDPVVWAEMADLERDPALVAEVLGQVDRGHAPAAELAQVAVAEGIRQWRVACGHVGAV